MSEWKPIEQAPRDGTEILLLVHTVSDIIPGRLLPGAMVIGSYRERRQHAPSSRGPWWRPNTGTLYDDREYLMPTHWMPLPDPPSS